MPALGKTWSRLSQMSWDEIRTRLGQEAWKRADLARFRAGLLGSTNGLGRTESQRSSFFFTPEELPVRLTLLRQHLPDDVAELLTEADNICRHRFRLLGYEVLDYGNEIDWHFDAVHGKRAPLKPWFKIDFLDFSEVGDHKVIWELNRHQHLVTLAKAWLLTGDERYVQELLGQWCSWQNTNPYPMGINWASSLEVAFRTLSWLWVAQLLRRRSCVPTIFHAELVQGLNRSAQHIEKYLSTYFSPNTHLLGEALALFFVGTLCPEIPAARRWQQKGWEILLREAQRQVRPDGVYFEQALYYHLYALDFFLHARLLASANGMPVPVEFDRVVLNMLEVVRALSQAGPPEAFGDDDGGRLFNPRRNRTEHLSDPLAVGATIFQRPSLAGRAALTEEAIWLLGEHAVSYLRSHTEPATVEASSFAQGGIYVLASDAKTRQQVSLDAGPQGIGHSGHGHADALSLRLTAAGRRWLVDCGTGTYISSGNERNQFRGTAAHNTLRVDGQDQAVPEGPFAWSSLPSVSTDCWIAGKTLSLFAGSHTGYRRLSDPVLHRRFVFHLHGEFWLVRDVVEGKAHHLIEAFWHFAHDLEVVEAKTAFVAAGTKDDGCATRLAVVPVHDPRWQLELKAGLISPAYGNIVRAPQLRAWSQIRPPAEHAVILTPLTQAGRDAGRLVRLNAGASRAEAVAYSYEVSDETYHLFFASQAAPAWKVGPWESDARFLFCGFEEGRVTHFAMCNGSYARIGNELVFQHAAHVERLEWTSNHGASSSQASALSAFSSEALLRAQLLEV